MVIVLPDSIYWLVMLTEYFIVVALSRPRLVAGDFQRTNAKYRYWDSNNTGLKYYLMIESRISEFDNAATSGRSEFAKGYCVKISI